MTTLTPRENTLLAHLALYPRTRGQPGGAKDCADLWSLDETGKPVWTSTRFTLLHRLREAGLIVIGDLPSGSRPITLTERGRTVAAVLDQPGRIAAALDTIDVIAGVLAERDEKFIGFIDQFDHNDADTAELIYEMKRWLNSFRGIRAMEIRNAILGTTDVSTLGEVR
ncbi:hypothetical protein GCM10027059_48320 [Myceligenerans halotolerans]